MNMVLSFYGFCSLENSLRVDSNSEICLAVASDAVTRSRWVSQLLKAMVPNAVLATSIHPMTRLASVTATLLIVSEIMRQPPPPPPLLDSVIAELKRVWKVCSEAHLSFVTLIVPIMHKPTAMIALARSGSRVTPNAVKTATIPRQVDSWLSFSMKAERYLFIWLWCG